MKLPKNKELIIENIQHNCNISDARDHGIYTMCTMVLKLRNLYKWEKGIEPWKEPEPADLLDWIEAKENYWQTISSDPFRKLGINGQSYAPDDCDAVNAFLQKDKLIYGAGYGRSMKAVFFVAELVEQKKVAGFPVHILGKEYAKEMASPFAMAQEGNIYIRKDPLRFFLWDHIQELRASCRASFRRALELYGLLEDGQLNQAALREKLDMIVEQELNLFIYHEVGELLQQVLDSATLARIISAFPSSVIELVCRSIKDILADTDPQGLLAHIVQHRLQTSLSFYVGFLDGMRKELFPEMIEAWKIFDANEDWQVIEDARLRCRERQLEYAEKIRRLVNDLDNLPESEILEGFNKEILAPLGLDTSSLQDEKEELS